VIHAGNSSQIFDGAAALLVTTQERAAALGRTPIVRYHTAAVVGADADRRFDGTADRRAGLTLLVVEDGVPGFAKGRTLDKIGLKVQDTAELSFTDVLVPAALVGRGARVVLLDLPSPEGDKAAASLGDAARFVPADVTDTAASRPRSTRRRRTARSARWCTALAVAATGSASWTKSALPVRSTPSRRSSGST